MNDKFAIWGEPGSDRFQDAQRRGAATRDMMAKLRTKVAKRQQLDADDDDEDDTAAARRERMNALRAHRGGGQPKSGADRLAKLREQQRQAEGKKRVSIQQISIYVSEHEMRCDITYDHKAGQCVATVWPGARPDKKVTLRGGTMRELFDAIQAHVEGHQEASPSPSPTGRRSRKRRRRS